MSPQEMQQNSQKKVNQVFELLSLLKLRVEARERINQDGFIEKIVFWIDDEQYPSLAPEAAQPESPQSAKEEAEVTPEDDEVASV